MSKNNYRINYNQANGKHVVEIKRNSEAITVVVGHDQLEKIWHGLVDELQLGAKSIFSGHITAKINYANYDSPIRGTKKKAKPAKDPSEKKPTKKRDKKKDNDVEEPKEKKPRKRKKQESEGE